MGGEFAVNQKYDRCSQYDRPETLGCLNRTLLKAFFGLKTQPQGPVLQKQKQKQDTPAQAVRVQQRQQIAMIDTVLIDGNAFEDIGEGNSEQYRGRCTSDKNTPIPESSP